MFSIKSCYLLQFICLGPGAQAEEEEEAEEALPPERGLTETESEEAYCGKHQIVCR